MGRGERGEEGGLQEGGQPAGTAGPVAVVKVEAGDGEDECADAVLDASVSFMVSNKYEHTLAAATLFTPCTGMVPKLSVAHEHDGLKVEEAVMENCITPRPVRQGKHETCRIFDDSHAPFLPFQTSHFLISHHAPSFILLSY